MNIVKVCKIHGALTEDQTTTRKDNRNGKCIIRRQCYACVNESHKRSYEKNKEKCLARNLEYTRKNKDKIKSIRVKTRDKNRVKQNEYYRQKYNKETKELSDNYIKMILCRYGNLLYKDVPQELIGIKRACLAIKRKVKEINGD